MFGITGYGVFIITVILLALTPGTDTVYIMSRSMSQGKTAGIYSVLGVSTGTLVHTLLAALGLSIILTQSVILFTAVKIIGAAYLVYLGVRAIIERGGSISNQLQTTAALSRKRIYIQGMLTNISNPKVALFFISLLPQFVAADSSYGPLPFIILGITFSVIGTLWCLIVAFFSAAVTQKLREKPVIEMLMNKLTGIVFIALGIKLLQTKAS